jgi:Tol biopolymer transport system component
LVKCWSRDGKRLAGVVENENDQGSHVAVFSLISREYRVFPVAGDGDVWLSDNRRLLVGDGSKILLLDAETGSSHEVLSLERERINPDVIHISSDDRTIFFSSGRTEADIWMVTLDDEPQ